MSFPRETATRIEDMPHRFIPLERGREDGTCHECSAAMDDPRHVAWERMELASRETAAEQDSTSFRELGS